MTESKIIKLVIISLLLLFTAALMLWRSVRHAAVVKSGRQTIAQSSRPDEKQERDSVSNNLSQLAQTITSNLDTAQRTADSIKSILDKRLNTYNDLRGELNTIMKDSSNADISLVNERLQKLQVKVNELTLANAEVEKENQRLAKLLKTFSEKTNQPAGNVSRGKNTLPAPDPRPVSAEADNTATAQVNDFKLTALTADAQRETNRAGDAGVMVANFSLKNNSGSPANQEAILQILQPNGKVLQKNTWETGTFNAAGVRKIYSGRLSGDHAAGETRRYAFTIESDELAAGAYEALLYVNGKLVGRSQKILN